MELPIYTVDAFTSRPFRGNPAAVCLPERDLEASTMQSIAAEMNLSETAFVRPRPDGAFHLRWFTPAVEVPLCGHATLASAAVLLRERGVRASPVRFATLSGELRARAAANGIELDFPSNPPATAKMSPEIEVALGAHGDAFLLSTATQKLLVRLRDETAVRALRPDFGRLRAAGDKLGVKGVIVTAPGKDGVDFVSRYFAPWVGIDEDPVTGSAHTVLAPYWARELKKDRLAAHQASARGGDLAVEVSGDRVKMAGEAVVTMRGTLIVSASR
ncbi:MAG: PhzF family phenazine biosynthesis protein [Euryarchaeota archaeon]|nr:PhzF family phenazine biosynthesis protein [Euryarchaeota archaeon]